MHGLIQLQFPAVYQRQLGRTPGLASASRGGVSPPLLRADADYERCDYTGCDGMHGRCARLGAGDGKIRAYLVSHPNTEAVRRLLRFWRNAISRIFCIRWTICPTVRRMAYQTCPLPRIVTAAATLRGAIVRFAQSVAGFGHSDDGDLRVMADDYGDCLLEFWKLAVSREPCAIS